MERDLWTREDIRNMLRGNTTIIARLPDCQWKSGYLCAVESLAVMLGIPIEHTTADALQPNHAPGRNPT